MTYPARAACRILVLTVLFCLACRGGTAADPAAPPSAVATAPAIPPGSATAPAEAAVTPAPTEGGTIALPGGGSGWLALPKTPGKRPAILVIQEWWGVNAWIKVDVARFASQGYVALAVDLYRGKVAGDPGEAHELMRGLPEDRAIDDMRAGFGLLATRPDVDANRIGIVGWCMGGGYALAFAVAEPRLAAAVVNYGKLVTAPSSIAAIHAPLLGNFAGLDRGIAPDDVHAFADRLKASGKSADIKVYEGAKHAFMNPNNKEGYDEQSAKDAWARIDSFFARTLGS